MKILNNAVITKCGECKWFTYDSGKNKCSYKAINSLDWKYPIDPDTIDKDCPLASCEVIDILEGKDKIVRIEYGYNGCAFEANKISHIIIVKKPTTFKVEGEKTNE
jgi:hypothetical protein